MIEIRRSTVLAGARAHASKAPLAIVRTGADASTPPVTPATVVIPASATPVPVTVECADVPLRWMHLIGGVLVVVAGAIILVVGGGAYIYKRYA